MLSTVPVPSDSTREPSFPTEPPRPGGVAIVVVAACLAAALITSAQLKVPIRDDPTSPTVLLGLELLEWGLWSSAAPLVWWLDARWGFRTGRRWSALGLHLAAAALAFLAYNALVTVVRMEVQPDLAELGYGHAYLARYGLRLPTALSLYAAFVVVGYAAWWLTAHHRREAQRAQLEAQLATARLQALRMQLHPHFFFNTLHTIAGHVREGERDTAVELIARLSHLLRRTLRDAGRQEITLSEELDFVRDYLQLEQGRLGDALTPRIEAGEDVKDAAVPSLVLQPLVENAIRHGIAQREGAGELCIRASRSNGRLLLEVSDDGPGYHPTPGGEGVGLANTRERLAQLYGTDHRFEIGSRPGGGTAVRLEIPLRWRHDAGA